LFKHHSFANFEASLPGLEKRDIMFEHGKMWSGLVTDGINKAKISIMGCNKVTHEIFEHFST
jgi:hypothetical protein